MDIGMSENKDKQYNEREYEIIDSSHSTFVNSQGIHHFVINITKYMCI